MALITSYETASSPLASTVKFLVVQDGLVRLATLTQVLEFLMSGATYTDQSIASLSAGQAAGTTVVVAANASRKALMINPPRDCTMSFATGDTTGWPLFANVPNSWSMGECPVGDIYLYGLSTADAVEIREGS